MATGGVADAEMARVFNCGLGMIAVVAPDDAAAIAAMLAAAGEQVHRVGRIVARPRGRTGLRGRRHGERLARLRTAILISGRGSNMQALIEACRAPAAPAEIVLVLSNNPDAGGLSLRGDRPASPRPSSIIARTADRAAFDAELDRRLRAAGAEFVCLAGFMRLLTPAFVERWRDRMINIHPSLLPAFPGLDTHARALAAGVRFHGCTVHFVRFETDTGPIIVAGRGARAGRRHAGQPGRPRAGAGAPHLSAGAGLGRRGPGAGRGRPRGRDGGGGAAGRADQPHASVRHGAAGPLPGRPA